MPLLKFETALSVVLILTAAGTSSLTAQTPTVTENLPTTITARIVLTSECGRDTLPAGDSRTIQLARFARTTTVIGKREIRFM